MSQSSTLIDYQALSEHSDELGCVLPQLHSGHLTVNLRQCQQPELAEALAPWLTANGWYQTCSSTGLGMPEQLDQLLEGQWHQDSCSLHLTLVHHNHYQITEISNQAAAADTPVLCYREQDIWLRPQLKGQYNALRYRLWWQQQNGAWRPVMQQFVGLAHREEN